MPFTTYDNDALRLLSTALSEAMDALHRSKGSALTETEASEVSKRLTVILMTVFDEGERELAELKRAALEGVGASWGDAARDA
jgi:hypothetical protein